MYKSNKKKIIGSCDYIDYSYDEQLDKKQKFVESLLSKYAKIEKIVPMDNIYGYRNKVVATFAYKNKEIIAGTYERGTHKVIDNRKLGKKSDAIIEDKIAHEIIDTLRDFAKSFKMKIYDEDRDCGFLRHCLIRVAKNTNQIMLVLVTANPIFIGKNNFIKAILNKHKNIKSIIQNINDKNTSMILGDKEYVLYGKPYIEDILCGLKFRISSKSFYQVNPKQTEKLYNKALELAELKKNFVLIDAYCGVGTIGIIAANRVKEVISVELNKDAVKDAISNAKINNIKNITFYNEDASVFLDKFSENKDINVNKKVDVLIMDPPRSGSTKLFINSILKLAPNKVVYISCNPESLARDLKYFVESKKYKVMKILPFDCFPMTSHVECIALLSRK